MVDILCHAPHIRSDHKHASLQRFMDDQRAILQPNRGNYDRIDLIEDLTQNISTKTALSCIKSYATTALSMAHAAANANLHKYPVDIRMNMPSYTFHNLFVAIFTAPLHPVTTWQKAIRKTFQRLAPSKRCKNRNRRSDVDSSQMHHTLRS